MKSRLLTIGVLLTLAVPAAAQVRRPPQPLTAADLARARALFGPKDAVGLATASGGSSGLVEEGYYACIAGTIARRLRNDRQTVRRGDKDAVTALLDHAVGYEDQSCFRQFNGGYASVHRLFDAATSVIVPRG